MKIKLFYPIAIFFTITFFSSIALTNGPPKQTVSNSIYRFLIQYYKDCERGDSEKIQAHFIKQIDEEAMSHIISISKVYPLYKIEIIEINYLSEDPLLVEVVIKEIFRPEDYPPPYLEKLFILKDLGQFNWKIVEMGEPGVT